MKKKMRIPCFLLVVATAAFAQDQQWSTRAEQTNFQETSRYKEVIEYCHKLQKASPWIRFTTFGKSPVGRDLPLLILSKENGFTPEQARKSNAAVLLVINGIHAGEIAGKEATLMLLRDIAITKQKSSLLDHVIILAVPIYNVDGHERFGPYNRINQNGPKETGWRATSQNLNLNRDWLKADQPETRAMLRLFNSWLPDIVIDNHVTDGADYQYDITYIDDECVHSHILKYYKEDLEPFLVSSLAGSGHVVAPYFDFLDPTDPAKGIYVIPSTPRFSTGYATLQNRLSLVAESHMLKPFQTRVRAHYDFMEAVLKKLNESAQAIRVAAREADQETRGLGAKYDPDAKFPIRFRTNMEKNEPFLYRGIEYTRPLSPVSGGIRVIYGNKPRDLTVPFYRINEPEITVAPPLGYMIPPQWTSAIERLEAHGIEFSLLKSPVTERFETYRFSDVTLDATSYEGHQRANFKTSKVTEERILPAGSVVVRLNQRLNKVVLGLLEPEAPDSLVSWGFFNAIFEQKEYAETYVLEELAEEMMQKDPELKMEFENRVKTDAKFAGDPGARLQFFFERSPYWDRQKDAYPIVRITR